MYLVAVAESEEEDVSQHEDVSYYPTREAKSWHEQ